VFIDWSFYTSSDDRPCVFHAVRKRKMEYLAAAKNGIKTPKQRDRSRPLASTSKTL